MLDHHPCPFCGRSEIPGAAIELTSDYNGFGVICIFVCESCLSYFPEDVYTIEIRKFDNEMLPHVIFSPEKFPNLDTYLLLIDMLYGQFVTRGRGAVRNIRSATNFMDAFRQFRINMTGDWDIVMTPVSRSLVQIIRKLGLPDRYDMTRVDWIFMTNLFWKKQSGFDDNSLRVTVYLFPPDPGVRYSPTDVVMIMSTDSKWTDDLLLSWVGLKYEVLCDGIFRFDDREEACKNLYAFHKWAKDNYTTMSPDTLYTNFHCNVSCHQMRETSRGDYFFAYMGED